PAAILGLCALIAELLCRAAQFECLDDVAGAIVDGGSRDARKYRTVQLVEQRFDLVVDEMLFPGLALVAREQRTMCQAASGDRSGIDGVVAAVGQGQLLYLPERPDDFALRVQTEPDQALHQPSHDRVFEQEALPLGELPAPADAKRFVQPLGLKFV